MSAVASYRALFNAAGVGYMVIAFLGRLPLAMSQIGTLLVVSDATGRYAIGGGAAGALAVANAIGSPFAGALADRWGQRPVVLVQSLAGAVGLVAVLAVAHRPAPVIFATSAAAGLLLPQVGPLARVRWRSILAHDSGRGGEPDDHLVDTAFSYEGAADEVSFVLGPAIAGVVTLLAGPAGALPLAAALLAVFGSWFAVHPTARLAAGAGPHSGADPLWTAAFGLLVVAQFLIGAVFGSVQTGTTSLARDAGLLGLAGVIHGILGVGSAIAGFAIAAVPANIWYSTRQVASATCLLALALPLYWVHSLTGVALVMLPMGFAVAPYMISNFALAGLLVPTRRVGTAMTLLAGATGLGYAAGAAIAGDRADAVGAHGAYVVTIVAVWLMLMLALAANPALRRARTS